MDGWPVLLGASFFRLLVNLFLSLLSLPVRRRLAGRLSPGGRREGRVSAGPDLVGALCPPVGRQTSDDC
jgi:hypothetical protein